MINFVKHTLSVFVTLGLGVDVVVDADAKICLDRNGYVDVVAINRPIPNTNLAALARHAEAMEKKLARKGKLESAGGFREWIEDSLKT